MENKFNVGEGALAINIVIRVMISVSMCYCFTSKDLKGFVGLTFMAFYSKTFMKIKHHK